MCVCVCACDDCLPVHTQYSVGQVSQLLSGKEVHVMTGLPVHTQYSVDQVSQLLSGKEVCVMNGPADLPKAEMEQKVVEMGGTFVQNPGQ